MKEIDNILKELKQNCSKNDFFNKCGAIMPNRDIVIDILKNLRRILFPGYFGPEKIESYEDDVKVLIDELKDELKTQIEIAFKYTYKCEYSESEISQMSLNIVNEFISQLPSLQLVLLKDADAIYNGDPAASSKAIIVSSYPGMLAIYVYRVAHILYKQNVPCIPRMMTEYAHSRTGIDINAGATIGESFFIDHGTGIVIGETTIIGNNVKIYQGVTLGALSTRKGHDLIGIKRHPTIGNNVTIYSGASVLGGDTVIGDNCIIGGNTFITTSIPSNTKVTITPTEINNQKMDTLWEI